MSGAGGLSRIAHWIRMFALRFSHRARRRSCACSPCPKEGTCSTESKSCYGTKNDGKAGGNCAQEEPTEWVNSLVVVQKPTGAVRLFIDARDLNLAIKRAQYPIKTIDEVASCLKGAITSAFWMLQVASGS